MAPSYRDALEHIRRAFPQPVSDPIHDSYFVHSIMRALDQVDDAEDAVADAWSSSFWRLC